VLLQDPSLDLREGKKPREGGVGFRGFSGIFQTVLPRGAPALCLQKHSGGRGYGANAKCRRFFPADTPFFMGRKNMV